MAIKLGGDTNITLTNTSFTVANSGYDKTEVPLFTATSGGSYRFEGDLLDSGVMSVSININSTPKEIWTYYDRVTHHVTYEFTLIVGDVVILEASGNGSGSNLTVTKYADDIKEIYVGEGIDSYEAMRGPCPEGFHVPTYSERDGIKSMMDGLGLTNGNDWKEKLHMPYAGRRYYDSASGNPELKGNTGYYRLCKANGSVYGYLISISANYVSKAGNCRADGSSIRAFKDNFVVPDSSWTVIHGTLGNAGIFRDQTNGLISITSNGSTGYTIMDKNLGATTVYNSGDTLSEANCGKYYQWGNNYGFPFTGSVTTSTTQVDASNYGPGNYYSSSTLINKNKDWSSVQNDDLRGGETGIIKKGNVIEVYVGTTKVRPE